MAFNPTSDVYDSAIRPPPVAEAIRALRERRGLIGLLVSRNLIVRYKRSVIGLWWTLLHPLLMAAILWVIFSEVFRFNTGDVPYIVYLLSGVLLLTLFGTTVQAVGGSILEQTPTLTRLPVPPVIFAAAAAIASLATFGVALLALFAVQLGTGQGIAWTAPLALMPIALTLALGLGAGLIVAAVAARFADALDITRVLLQAIGWLTPTFYTVDIVPDRFRAIIDANPVAQALAIFREFMYDAPGTPPWWSYAVAIGSATVIFIVGVVVFARMWRHTVTML